MQRSQYAKEDFLFELSRRILDFILMWLGEFVSPIECVYGILPLYFAG